MLAAGAVGLGLSCALVAGPAEAATATSGTSQTQCQSLLGCLSPIVGGLTGTVSGVVTTLTTTLASPPVSVTLPDPVTPIVDVLATKPTGVTPPPPPPPPTPPPHHTKPHPKPHPVAVTTTPRTGAASTGITAPVTVQPPVVPPAPTNNSNLLFHFVDQVARAAEQVVTLFGWNLLALIPMGGIAFVISRRMATARRSVSGLL